MISTIASLTASIAMAATMATAPVQTSDMEEWHSIGEYRITTYETHCNEPEGNQSASGVPLEYGMVAMNDYPFGTEIMIDGEKFVVMDRCGIENTVDIWKDTDVGYCDCDYLDYKEVYVKR